MLNSTVLNLYCTNHIFHLNGAKYYVVEGINIG